MARARNIKYGFFQNEDLPEIEPLGRLLFIGLWCLADREGRLEDRPKRIKMQLFPAENCDTDRYLSDLARYDFITRYEIDGQRYIQINNFSKHQTPHKTEKESVIPPPLSRKKIKEPSTEKDFSLENNDDLERLTENVGALTVNPPLQTHNLS